MKVSIDEVKYIAKLAKLSFSDEEAEKFAGEFESILDQFQYLSDMDLEIDGEIEKEELIYVNRYRQSAPLLPDFRCV